jgi:hypothetical protein
MEELNEALKTLIVQPGPPISFGHNSWVKVKVCVSFRELLTRI